MDPTASPNRPSLANAHFTADTVQVPEHSASHTTPHGGSYINSSQCYLLVDQPTLQITCDNLFDQLSTQRLDSRFDPQVDPQFEELSPGEKAAIMSWLQKATHQELEAAIEGFSQSTILQYWLRVQNMPFPITVMAESLRNAVIVGLDAEWYEHDSSYITELGISTLDPTFISGHPSPWAKLKGMITHHVRIKSNAHMINSDLCSGHPEKFQFGNTTFVTFQEAQDMLKHAFTRYDRRTNKLRPVIFVGHAVDNDITMMKERFGIDINQLGTVVATLDTQVLAREQGLAAEKQKIKLGSLLAKFDISESYLHNAGNDIVCTMMSALLMTASEPWRGGGMAAYNDMKAHLRKGRTIYGTTIFCTACNSDNHIVAACPYLRFCATCHFSAKNCHLAYTHNTDKCVMHIKPGVVLIPEFLRRSHSAPPNACPCEFCIASMDRTRNNSDYAYSHLAQDCIFLTGSPETI